jgi:glucose/arabinose dehydrogenase
LLRFPGMGRVIGIACVIGATTVLAAGGTAGCFKMRSSKGGGKISATRAEQAAKQTPSPYDIEVQPGYRVELVADKLTFPTGIAFGDRDEVYVVEAGYSYGEMFTKPRLLAIEPGGNVRELATGDGEPWTGVAYHDGALFVAHGGEKTGGRIVRYQLDGDKVSGQRVLVDKLPSIGDHHTNGPAISRDGYVYFGQGVATNSGVVGPDNFDFGWLKRNETFHDIPCKDIKLAGLNFKSQNPLTKEDDEVTTGAYLPYKTPSQAGQVVRGAVPCTGAVMRVRATGGNVELVAWGFRNPFGLAFDPTGALFVTDNGFDTRGSRPIFGSADSLWRVEPGTWYGWPDYSEGRAVTAKFYSEGDGEPGGFLLAEHPNQPPDPAGILPVHASADGFDFSRSTKFGYAGWAFIALFGDMAPTAGKVLAPVGFSVVRVDPRSGDIAEFARNRRDKAGPASKQKLRGFERPVAARFDRSGNALYVVDFGVVRMTDKGAAPEPQTGRVWRIVKEGI